jgi:ATP-binding cassette subfamily C protein CydD
MSRRPVDARLLRSASAARSYLALTVLAGLAGAGLILAQAGLLARALAGAATGVGIGALAGVLTGLAIVLAGRAALGYLGETTALRAAAKVKSQLRQRLITRVTEQGAGSTADRGELAVLATRGLDGIDAYFARYLPQLVLAALVPVAVIIAIGLTDWLSALMIVISLPLVPVFGALLGMRSRAQASRQLAALARLGGHFLDVVQGLPTLRVFGRASAQESTIDAMTSQYRSATMATLRVAFLSGFVLELAAALATALVAVEVGLRLLAGHIGYQAALFALLLTPEAFLPLRNAAAQFHASAEGAQAAERVLDLLDEPAGPAAGPAKPRPDSRQYRPGGTQLRLGTPQASMALDQPDYLRRCAVTLTDVTLAYQGRAEPALAGISLQIRPGEHLVLTGPTGAGKSSLLALLLRSAAPTGGRIEIAGRPLADLDIGPWLAQLAWVPQHPHMFATTVAGNIALGRPAATRAEVTAAARLAGADNFIRALPDGYDTNAGERGLSLSAGQRQQIALARAFLRDAAVMLLDEPTAHLDPVSACLVRESVRAVAADRTVIYVTHQRDGIAALGTELTLGGGQVAQVVRPPGDLQARLPTGTA